MVAARKPGVKAPFPAFIEPALASSVDTVPNGRRWVHEIKFDGYRVQVHLKDAPGKIAQHGVRGPGLCYRVF